MECQHVEELSNKEYLQQFQRKVMQQRIPLSGMIALTYRCNLRCVHCYLGEGRTPSQDEKELTTTQWHSVA